MSHRKFEAPRHGSLGFMPKHRSRTLRARIHSFPVDTMQGKPHLTAFAAFKAGMTHVVRCIHRVGSKSDKKDVLEAVTIVEAPPMVIVGVVGYRRTVMGYKAHATVWAQHLADEFKRRLYKSWSKAEKSCFGKYVEKYQDGASGILADLEMIKQSCQVVRVIAHTQMKGLPLNQKKSFIMEIQINGGSVAEKVDFAFAHFEKEVMVSDVFTEKEQADILGVSKGKGFEGVTTRFGTRKLPRKTNKGLRKVACIGAWHPSRVMTTVARAGQYGYYHRTEINKRIYRIGNGSDECSASTEADPTRKPITPMGGFPHYGMVRNDFVMFRGSCVGPRKRIVTLRKTVINSNHRAMNEQIDLKFIDTSSKIGHGRFQTIAEKVAFYGPKKHKVNPRISMV